ncbi:S-adenosylmethionine transporter [Malassezia pachydermatis]|uniref:S-adenosylmethionine transporter n=1 Tax=Malassezia pachydermatis TaxID=77020 RepID=A0A0M8MLK0_9BASI|nr:s-adenosylmethionine transporter [Malassezia pachydermatis]KOS14008.1 s-adenosylmethionine transporter [Malassezia pachydermatis]
MEVEHVEEVERLDPRFSTALMAGAASGLSVDLLFYPIDTIKTRLQSAQGFWKSGGFAGVYRGMGSVAVGSAPGASIFFVTYESSKSLLSRLLYPDRSADAKVQSPYVHMAAATLGETAACMVRVPTEVVKSRQQTSAYGRISSLTAFREVLSTEGVAGLYRGYGSTIFREIPFTCIQFPLYEFLKHSMAGYKSEPSWWQAASAGSIAGSFAAAVTTPLDVIKTRIMLAKASADVHVDTRILSTLRAILAQGGPRALFAGVVPRTLWIGLGGAVFLGTFDATAKMIEEASRHVA